jgi:hypothetical protein
MQTIIYSQNDWLTDAVFLMLSLALSLAELMPLPKDDIMSFCIYRNLKYDA